MAMRLWRSRELVFTLVKRDLKIRYKSSALGFLWSFGRPLLLMLVIWAVFSLFAGIQSSHPILPFPLHLLTALIPWMFISNSTSESLYAIMGNSNVIKKVWLPAEVFPMATVIGHLIHLVLASFVLFAFVAGYAVFGHVPEGQPGAGERLGLLVLPSWEILLLPFLIILMAFFSLGLALILSSLNVFYQDMSSITEIGLSAWFYLSPIIYPAILARDTLQQMGYDVLYWVWLANPVAPMLIAWRRIFYGRLFQGAPEISDTSLLTGLSLSTISTVLILYAGVKLFRHQSKRFADEL